jgi:hypothetical protein
MLVFRIYIFSNSCNFLLCIGPVPIYCQIKSLFTFYYIETVYQTELFQMLPIQVT